MRKIRNVFMIMLVVLCSMVLTACGCGAEKDTNIYPDALTLSCQDTDNYKHKVEDGVMYIDVYKGATFTISYAITPSNVTDNQVNLNIDNDGKLAIRPVTGTYVYKGATSITFTAFEKGEATITLTMNTARAGSTVSTTCIVTVSEAKDLIEPLSTPKNLSYSIVNSTLYWDKVTSTVDSMGNETDIEVDGVAVGLVGYKVKVATIDGTETEEVVTTNSYSNFELNTTYTVSVKAIGNVFNAKDSETYSTKFTFQQLAPVDDLSISNGVVTWTEVAPETEYKVYYGQGSLGESLTQEVYGTTYTLGSDVALENYNVYVVAYPKDGLRDETLDYVSKGNVRYYKSVASNTLSVIQLKDLEWRLNNATTKSATIAGASFDTTTGSSVLEWKFVGGTTYPSTYGVKYDFKLVKCDEFGVEIPLGDGESLPHGVVSDDPSSLDDNTIEFNSERLAGGYYKVVVQAIGNEDSTLKSSIMETDAIYYTQKIKDTEITIADNQIRYTRESGAGYSAIEYYFVDDSDSSISLMTKSEADILNLSNIGLSSGTYDVYAKVVGNTTQVSTNSDVSEKLVSFTILGSVANSYMTKDSNIYFTAIDGADSYKLSLVIDANSTTPAPLAINQRIVPTEKDNLVYFNFFEVLKAHLDSSTQEDVDAFIDGGEYTYSIIAVSDDPQVISGGYSTPKTFYRQNPIDSVSLDSSVITWAFGTMYTTNTEVKIAVNGTTLDTSFRNQTTLDINANTQAKDLINTNASNTFKFRVLGQDGNATEACVLDSTYSEVSFGVTKVVESLSVLDDNLTWQIRDYDETEEGNTYEVHIYKHIDGVNDLRLETISGNETTSIALSDISGKIKEVNDRASAENTLVNKVLYVTITQVNNNKFTNVESDKYYFYFYNSPSLSVNYKASDSSYNLDWNKVESVSDAHARYSVNMTHKASIAATPTSVITDASIPSDVTTYRLGTVDTNTFASGIYEVTIGVNLVEEYYGNAYVNGADMPYYLFASSDTKSFTVVDGATSTFTYADNKLSWNRVTGVSFYTVNYKTSGSVSGYITLADNLLVNTCNNFGALPATTYDFELVLNPSYDYSVDNDGIESIIINNRKVLTNIVKLQTVQSAGTKNGVIYFNSPILKDDYIYTIIKNGKALASSEYRVVETAEDLIGGKYTYLIELNESIDTEIELSFKVSYNGAIDSDESNKFYITPMMVDEFENYYDDITGKHYLRWKDSGYDIVKFHIEQVQPARTTILYTVDAGDTFEDTGKEFYKIDGYFYYLFNDAICNEAKLYTYYAQAYTTRDGYLNSGRSNELYIRKLGNDIKINIDGGELYIEEPVVDYQSKEFSVTISHYTLDAGNNKIFTSGVTETIVLDTSTDNFVDLSTCGEGSLKLAGGYAVTAKFIGECIGIDDKTGKELYYISSTDSVTVYFQKAKTPTIYMTGGEISWTNPIGSGDSVAYNVHITNESGSMNQTIYSIAGTTLTDEILELNNIIFALDEKYYISVDANSANYLHSEMSKIYTVEKLEAITNLAIGMEQVATIESEEGDNVPTGRKVFTWENNNVPYRIDPNGDFVYVGNNYVAYDPIEHENETRYSYTCTHCIIYYVDSEGNIAYEQTITDFKSASAQDINTDLLTGTYKVYMKVIGTTDFPVEDVDDLDKYALHGYLSSDVSSDDVSLYVTEQTIDIKVEDGYVEWSPVSVYTELGACNAYAYQVLFDSLDVDPDSPSEDDPASGFSLYTTSNSLDLSGTILEDKNVFGSYRLTIKALTSYDPLGKYAMIITTKVDEDLNYNTKNTINLFKVNGVEDYKILDGMFSWTVTLESIDRYMSANGIVLDNLAENNQYVLDMEAEVFNEYRSYKNLMGAIQYIQGVINNTEKKKQEALTNALSPYINFKLDINGIGLNVVPMKIEMLNSLGDVVGYGPEEYFGSSVGIDLSSIRIRYYFDLVKGYNSMISGGNSGNVVILNLITGFYNVSVSSFGNATLALDDVTKIAMVSSNPTDTIKVYKPNTPVGATSNQYFSDINNSNFSWNLVTTNNTTFTKPEYFANYRIEATPKIETEEDMDTLKIATKDITFGDGGLTMENTNNEENFHTREVNLSQNFTANKNNEEDANYVTPNKSYTIRLYVRGTEDSSIGEPKDYYYINSSAFTANTNMCMLDTPTDFSISRGVISWTNTEHSTKIRLVIHGAYDLTRDYTGNGAGYNTTNWQRAAYDNIAGNTEYSTYGVSSVGTEIEIITAGMDAQNTYVLGNRFATGGYIISIQAVGDGKGVVDSNLTDEVNSLYAVKLSTTDVSVHRGSFVWPTVPDATSYQLEVYAESKTEGAEDHFITSFGYSNYTNVNINNVNHALYDLDPLDPDFNNADYDKFYIKVSARNYRNIGDVHFIYGDFVSSSAYSRLTTPHIESIDNLGNLEWWSNASEKTLISGFNVYANYNITDVSVLDVIECGAENTASIKGSIASNEIYATQVFNLQVRAMTGSNNHLHSASSKAINMVKMDKPDLRVENGDMKWDNAPGNLPSEVTDVYLQVYYKILVEDQLETKYLYNGTVKANGTHEYLIYSPYDATENLLPVTMYTTSVNYVGTTIEDGGNKEIDYAKHYYLSSSPMEMNVQKLDNVTLSNYNMVDSETNAVTSFVRWETNPNTDHYKVIIKATYDNGGEGSVETEISTLNASPYFMTTNVDGKDYTCINIDMVLNGDRVISQVATYDKLVLNIYVQAIGTIDSKQLEEGATAYVSSNFSQVLQISVPPTPEGFAYDSDTASIYWNSEVDAGYDIEAVLYYTTTVTKDLLDTYWIPTSNTYQEGKDGVVNKNTTIDSTRHAEVMLRNLIYAKIEGQDEFYTIVVEDNLKIVAEDGKTVERYYLNQVADYDFDNEFMTRFGLTSKGVKIRATVHSDDGAGAEGRYKSGWTAPITMKNVGLFGAGDGTKNNPYEISTADHLDSIDKYTSKYFKMVDNITTNWTVKYPTIDTAFDGVFDGNNKTIRVTSITENPAEAIIGLFGYNYGTIKNLEVFYNNIELSKDIISVGGIAVYNYNTIDKCQVAGGLIVNKVTADTKAIQAGGITCINEVAYTQADTGTLITPTVSNSTNAAVMKITGKNNYSTEMGGVACVNKGYIYNSGMLAGSSVYANWVGGIVTSNADTARITNAFSKGVIYSCDKNNNTLVSTRMGGIAAANNGVIENSYSIAELSIMRQTKADGSSNNTNMSYIGGLIGINTTNTINLCVGNYVIFRLLDDNADGSVKANWFDNTGTSTQNIGVVIGRCNFPSTGVTNNGISGWNIQYAVEDAIAGLIEPTIDGELAPAVGKYNNNNIPTKIIKSFYYKTIDQIAHEDGVGSLGDNSNPLDNSVYSYYNYMNTSNVNIDNEGVITSREYHYPILDSEFDLPFAMNLYYDIVTVNLTGVYYTTSQGERIDIENDGSYTFETEGTYVRYVVITYTIYNANKTPTTSGPFVVGESGSVFYDRENTTISASVVNATDSGKGDPYTTRIYLSGSNIVFADIDPNDENKRIGVDEQGKAYIEFDWYLKASPTA